MKSIAQIIQAKLQSLYVQGLITRKGWTEQQTADYVLDFITCGTKLSFFDFMESRTFASSEG